ncbi:MAG: sugar phosphate isomerase/epimerase [Candidatus Sumerlaeota bacterium]|nr:sugar phosphate isomerase/epimerase [Candidatus Sumerlaeota bacterium]
MLDRNSINRCNRREFVRAAGLGAAGLGALAVAGGFSSLPAWGADAADPYKGLKVGMASYTLQQFSLDDAITVMKELELKYISLKDFHLKLTATKEECQTAAKKLKDAGITLMSGGVITLKDDEAASRKAFEYARNAGMPCINVSFPPAALALVEKLGKEYKIRIAIHNHGPTDKNWPSAPENYKKIKNCDPIIGLCVDIGHAVRWKEKELEVMEAVKDRIYDFHIKDVSGRDDKGSTCVMGKGVIDLKGVVKALMDMKYQGIVGLEYEKKGPTLVAELKENFAYLRKIMAEL